MTTTANDMAQASKSPDTIEIRPLLTREDTASYLAVSLRTLDRLISGGAIPAYRIGGHRRFRIQDIDAFVASRAE